MLEKPTVTQLVKKVFVFYGRKAGVWCLYLNERLAPATYIFFVTLVLTFGNRDEQDVSIYTSVFRDCII
jgi:hypothetical protein